MTCKRCGGHQWVADHHIIYKSEARGHKELNNSLNLIPLCQGCHKWYHDKKIRRQGVDDSPNLVEERGLVDLFGKRIILFDKN